MVVYKPKIATTIAEHFLHAIERFTFVEEVGEVVELPFTTLTKLEQRGIFCAAVYNPQITLAVK